MMSRDSDTNQAEGHGQGEACTPDPGVPAEDSSQWDGDADTMAGLLAAVAAAPPVRLDRHAGLGIRGGALVDGTYRVLRRLGGGGMGVVYLAEHIELGREVALKLHLGDLDSQELVRLRGEARVMARLAHPNVLAVHGVGTHEGRMFIAMEYAAGGTLGAWVEAMPRPWRDTVAMFVQAARGLGAAHRLGLVHRDFKPDNVLIGADGRPRVADFGLARRWDDPSEPAAASPLEHGDDAQRLTVTGAIVGTPAYMSPEQFDGIQVGPASDQFSFCVALYEALLGRRPFVASTTLELAQAVHTGQLQPAPAGTQVPSTLLTIVARGLRPTPGDRYPSMEALADALERLHGARRRRVRWAVGGTTVVAALLMGNQVAVMTAPEPCERVDDDLGVAWDDARRDAVATAWSARGGSSDSALALVDAWVEGWKAQRRETCEATRVQQVQSELAFTLRMACLDRMAARLDALTGELADGMQGEPSPALLEANLPELARCEDVEMLDGLVNRFSSDSMVSRAGQERAWLEADALIARAHARLWLERPGGAALAEQALALARRHGLVMAQIDALTVLADESLRQGDIERAAELNDQALQLALGIAADDAASELVVARAETALGAARLEEAAVHLSYFDALIARVREPNAEQLRRRARVVRGRLYLARGDAEAAIRELEPLCEDVSVDPGLRRVALTAVGSAYQTLGQHARAIAVDEQIIGLLVEAHGADAPDLVPAINNLANSRLSLGQLDEALVDLERAEAIVLTSLGPEHPYLPAILTNQGVARRRLGQLGDARALQERSLGLRIKLYGADHPSLAYALDELGEIARLEGKPSDALEPLRRAQHLREASLGTEHPLLAETLALQARVLLDEGDVVHAEAALERAHAILASSETDPVSRTRVELLLARATEARDLPTARQWASDAREHAAAAGTPGDEVRAEAEAWLRAHPVVGAVGAVGAG